MFSLSGTEPGATIAKKSPRTKSTEEPSEATKSQLDDVSVRPDGDYDVGGLQEESSTAATATTPTPGRTHCFALGQSEHGR
jgi:hypothetical protein